MPPHLLPERKEPPRVEQHHQVAAAEHKAADNIGSMPSHWTVVVFAVAVGDAAVALAVAVKKFIMQLGKFCITYM